MKGEVGMRLVKGMAKRDSKGNKVKKANLRDLDDNAFREMEKKKTSTPITAEPTSQMASRLFSRP